MRQGIDQVVMETPPGDDWEPSVNALEISDANIIDELPRGLDDTVNL